MRILVLEDDPDIRDLISITLKRQGYSVDEASGVREAEGLASSFNFDLLVFDIGLPEGPRAGLELVERLRAERVHTPTLFLSAHASPADRILGLDAGADDYLTKPFELGELLARLRALQRRTRSDAGTSLECRGLHIRWAERSVLLDGRPVHLTAKEFGLLEVLASHRSRVYTREELIERVWGGGLEAESNVVEVLVRNLRRKLGDDLIETVRGVGYRFGHE